MTKQPKTWDELLDAGYVTELTKKQVHEARRKLCPTVKNARDKFCPKCLRFTRLVYCKKCHQFTQGR